MRCISERIESGFRGRAALVLLGLLLGGCAGRTVPDLPWSDSAFVRYESALASLDAGRPGEAADAFAELAERYPDYTGPRRQLARLALAAGDTAMALEHLEIARDACDACAPVLTELALVMRKEGRFAEALAHYEAALAADAAFAPAHFDLAVLHELYLDRPHDAIRHYETYLMLSGASPEDAQIRAWIARLERDVSARSDAQVAIGDAVLGPAP